MHAERVKLREFGPDDADAIRAFVGIENARIARDSPWAHPLTPYRQEMWMRFGWDGEPARSFLVLDHDGKPVGTARINTSEWDNLELAWLGLSIHPDHRRHGHGSAALEALHDECRRLGRPLVGLDGWDDDAARGFAAAVGYEKKSQSVNRRQDVWELGADFFEAACAEAEPLAHDYELVRIAGRSPEEMHEQLVRVTESINDSPLDDLEIEDEVFTPQRIRDFEHAQTESGQRLYRVVARHRGTGELAGHTVATVDAERPAIGAQEDTTVVRAHRGHRLGLLLKADLCRWLLAVEPQLRTLDTWNAESNDHMISVNERLGYRVLARVLEFQRRV